MELCPCVDGWRAAAHPPSRSTQPLPGRRAREGGQDACPELRALCGHPTCSSFATFGTHHSAPTSGAEPQGVAGEDTALAVRAGHPSRSVFGSALID
jgi:hypothetical protein